MTYAQNNALETLMKDGYKRLQSAGVITTPAAQSASAVVGQVYTGANQALTSATTVLTNGVNTQVASLVTNASKYGTQLTAEWAKSVPAIAKGLPGALGSSSLITGITSSLPAIPNIGSLTSGITPNLASVKTAMDSLGKASQFAATASSTLTGGLDKLSTLSVSGLTDKLPSASGLIDRASGAIQGQAKALIGSAQGQANALIGSVQGQANALIGQAKGQFNSLLGQGDKLVASVQKAAGYANTVNRATVDVAFAKVLGSNKIPTPNFGPKLSDSASVAAALDIKKAQGILSDLQSRGTALVNQAQGQATALVNQAQGQVTAVATQIQGQANSALSEARSAASRIV